MNFARLMAANLSRRPVRTLLTGGALALALAAVMALLGVARSFETEFLRLYSSRGVDLIVQRAGGMQQLARGLPESLGDKIRQLPGVQQVTSGLMDVIALEQHDEYNVFLNGWPPDSPWFRELHVVAGRGLEPGERGKMLLGRILAGRLNVQPGAVVEIYAEPFEVVGIYESSSYFENGGAVTLLAEMQRLMGRPGQVTAFLVSARESQSRAAVEQLGREIAAQASYLRADLTDDYVNREPNIRVAQAMAWATSGLALVVGVIGMLNTMVMSVHERTREMGVLRAIGWRRRRVIALVVGESLALSGLAFLLAAPLAMLLVFGVSKIPSAAGFVGATIQADVLARGLGMALFIGLCGALWPAWWGANLPPTEALRRHAA